MGNKPTIAVFFVSESEYPKLQRLFPDEYTLSYAEFSQFTNNKIRENAAHATFVKTNVDVDQFLAWCSASKINPDADARPAYAAFLHANSS